MLHQENLLRDQGVLLYEKTGGMSASMAPLPPA